MLENLKFITIDEVLNDSKWLEEINKLDKSIDNKLEIITSAIECPKEYLQLFQELIKLIECTVQKRFRKHRVRVYGFGSFITGLALKNCDLDLYVEFDPPFETQESTLKILRSFFYSKVYSNVFSKIILIKAKVPILRCDHIIGFQCDVSICNELARYNSELIKFYLSLHPRFLHLFLLVKLWLKRTGLQRADGFKSYTLVLLLIYFLQERRLMPSVITLQSHKLCPPARIVAGFNSSFLNDKSAIEDISLQKLPMIELLADFFNFYSKFEFGLYVISPYMGEKVLKPLLHHFKMSSCSVETLSKFNENTYISVQDVFQLDYNTAGNVSKNSMREFQLNCKKAANICESFTKNNQNICVENLFWSVGKESTNQHKYKKQKLSHSSEDVVLCPRFIPNAGDMEDEKREAWLAQSLAYIKEVLIKIGLVDLILETDSIIECQTNYQAYNKKLRCEVSQKIIAAHGGQTTNDSAVKCEKTQQSQIDRHEAISAAILELPNKKLDTPLKFSIQYRLETSPTVLELTFIWEGQGVFSQESRFQFIKQFSQWISFINT